MPNARIVELKTYGKRLIHLIRERFPEGQHEIGQFIYRIIAVWLLILSGVGSMGTSMTPAQSAGVNGVTGEAIAIAAVGWHTCLLTKDNCVKCWVLFSNGQLGDGSSGSGNFHNTPVYVVGLSNGAQAITAGGVHTCALTQANGVKCWGINSSGQLGDGTQADRGTPVDVKGLTDGIQAITAGGSHTCALTTAGGVKCWGHNTFGQLGDGTQVDRDIPVDVAGLSSGVQAITAGWLHTCALTTTGGVKCWGWDSFGQLGDGTQVDHDIPVDVAGLRSGVQAVTAGGVHTCALTMADGVKCWGRNSHGQLGDGTQINHDIPVSVVGLNSAVKAITAGGGTDYEHTCALTTAGGVKCWGYNYSGQLGDGTQVDRDIPVDVVGLTSGIQAITASGGHTCALTTAGGAKCWGINNFGQLGDGTQDRSRYPGRCGGSDQRHPGHYGRRGHTCALTTTGAVKCWGINSSGQLGDDTQVDRDIPVDVAGLSSSVQAIAAGGGHTCALTTAGGVKCWGDNISGQLGDGTQVDRATPVDVVGLSSGIQAITAGGGHTCALTTAGGVKCWGYNYV